MEVVALKTHTLKKSCDLFGELAKAFSKNHMRLREKDIIVVSSKVAALAQGRLIKIGKLGLRKLIEQEADVMFEGCPDVRFAKSGHQLLSRAPTYVGARPSGKIPLTLKNGVLIPQAGIDVSNAPKGYAILWPKNPFKAALSLWWNMRKKFHLKKTGVAIVDSHCQPLRWGTTGLAIGWAGFKGIEDARGEKDIYGKKLRVTKKAVADNLASAALLVMGEAAEKIPFVIIRNAPVKFTTQRPRKNDIVVKPEKCIFNGIYNKKILSI